MARRILHLFETKNAPQTSVGHFLEVPSGINIQYKNE